MNFIDKTGLSSILIKLKEHLDDNFTAIPGISYNEQEGKVISEYSTTDEIVLVSKYPITFSKPESTEVEVAVSQYINYLVTESGYFVYTLTPVKVSEDKTLILIGASIYESL